AGFRAWREICPNHQDALSCARKLATLLQAPARFSKAYCKLTCSSITEEGSLSHYIIITSGFRDRNQLDPPWRRYGWPTYCGARDDRLSLSAKILPPRDGQHSHGESSAV